ncbi:MAG TPA: hypothetical protein VF030_07885 [Solirubrobacterales bacterium]
MSQFTCPRCGSHEFGSSNCVTGPVMRKCGGCNFRWPESDDHRYGLEPVFVQDFGPKPEPCSCDESLALRKQVAELQARVRELEASR